MDFVGTFLNKDDSTPLYYQLYKYLLVEIQAQRLRCGERLPGKRSAAAVLGVSVNTVDAAYQMLAAEGYVEAHPRSGFAVNKIEQIIPQPDEKNGDLDDVPSASCQEKSSGGHRHYAFRSDGLDLSLFPLKTWNRLMREVLAEEGKSLFMRGEAFGDGILRGAIAQYLRAYRGVRCQSGQLVVGAGLEVLLGMLARLLKTARFAVESPGYPKTGYILENMGLSVLPVEVDSFGMCPDALRQSGAGVACLTPSHQFPTGAVMPVARRLALLQWARQGTEKVEQRIIIEDDYDSEFRFDGRPLPCMQGLDGGGCVVYAGTFSRSLAPGLRVAYLVLPPPLFLRWRQAYGEYACTVSRPEQHTLARFMAGGHFARGLNRMRAAYRRRRDLLLAAVALHMPDEEYRIENTHTGLYFLLRLPGKNACQTARRAMNSGLWVRALNEYYTPAPGRGETADALVLGYGGLDEKDIEEAAALLCKVIKS